MFIDYLPLLLINMSAGFFLLALFVIRGFPQDKDWAPSFFIPGLIAFLGGLHLAVFWPLPGSYNVAFAGPSVFLGILFLGLAFSLYKNINFKYLTIYGFFCGLVAVLVGIRIINLNLTKEPFLSGLGFILSGLAGIFSYPLIKFKNKKFLLYLAAFILIIISLLWLRVGLSAYWMHLFSLLKWKPIIFK